MFFSDPSNNAVADYNRPGFFMLGGGGQVLPHSWILDLYWLWYGLEQPPACCQKLNLIFRIL